MAPRIAASAAEWRRSSCRTCDDIIISPVLKADDPFYYLTQIHIYGGKEKNVDCDILMTDPQTDYGVNALSFRGTLEAGTCAVSRDLAVRDGLKIGDVATVSGTDISFRVAAYLPAQAGLDRNYLHDGIVILAYEEDLLARQYSFVSFSLNGDGFQTGSGDVFLHLRRQEREQAAKLALYVAICLAAFAVTVGVCDGALLRPRFADYRLFGASGERAGKLYARIVCEGFCRTVLPFLLAAALMPPLGELLALLFPSAYIPSLMGYGLMYALPILALAACGTGMLLLYSAILLRRVYLWHPKTSSAPHRAQEPMPRSSRL